MVEVIPLTALAVDAVPQPLLSVWRGPASPPTGLPTILSGQTHGPYSIRPGHMQPWEALAEGVNTLFLARPARG